MKTRPLGTTGIDVPVVSLGAAGLGGVYGDIDQDRADATIREAFAKGMNLVDTSPHYGLHRSEEVLGRALAGIDRSSYLLTTKCGRLGDEWDFSAEAIKRSIPESLERLQLDYIDVIQCHDIEFGDLRQVVGEALPVLRDFQRQGLVRAVGITGYYLDVLERVALSEGVDSVMSYCNYNLQDRRLLDTAERLGEHGIGVFAASPLHMSALTEQGAPWWHPGTPEMLEATRRVVEICREAGTTIEDLAMRFALNLPDDSPLSSIVVGCTSPSEVDENLAALGKLPDPELLARVEEAFGDQLNVGWVFPQLALS